MASRLQVDLTRVPAIDVRRDAVSSRPISDRVCSLRTGLNN